MILLLLAAQSGYAQKIEGFATWTKIDTIDAIAKTIRYEGSLKQLSADLTKNCDNDIEKARSIFTWITENVAYDYKFINKKKRIKPPKYKKGCDRTKVYNEWEDDLLMKVIHRKKAICDGYARLFRRLCGYAGIQCSIVTGYTKQMPKQVGKMGRQDHAWNVIKADGNYYFLDVTWASGYCVRNKKGKLKKFIKEYHPFYWLTPADKFHRNHFPREEEWVRHCTYTKEQYRDNAWVNTDFLGDLEILEPQSGVLNACVGDTIRFRLDYSGLSLDEIRITTNLYDMEDFYEDRDKNEENEGFRDEQPKRFKKHFIPYQEKEDTLYSFYYVIDDKRIRYIDVNFHNHHAMRFNVKISDCK